MANHVTDLSPPQSICVSRHQIASYELIPNTSIQHHPLIIYHSAFPPSSVDAASVEAHLRAIGVAIPQWRYPMYQITHFHSTAHELLVVYQGAAVLCFGGEENPARIETKVAAGDVIFVPAGVGHRLLRDEELDGRQFMMVGAYEAGKQWDMCYGKEGEEEKIKLIEGLEWWKKDPIYGEDGRLFE
jgi:uncharacterized protein YjlB